MAYYVINNKQVAGSIFMVALFTAACVFFVMAALSYRDLPDVYVGQDGRCVKVVNVKNGDVFTCQDKDVALRRYNVIHVE